MASCAGISPAPLASPHIGSLMRNMCPYLHVIMQRDQSWGSVWLKSDLIPKDPWIDIDAEVSDRCIIDFDPKVCIIWDWGLNCRHCADNIFKFSSFNRTAWIFIEVSQKRISTGRIGNKLALVWIVIWRHISDKPPLEPMIIKSPGAFMCHLVWPWRNSSPWLEWCIGLSGVFHPHTQSHPPPCVASHSSTFPEFRRVELQDLSKFGVYQNTTKAG